MDNPQTPETPTQVQPESQPQAVLVESSKLPSTGLNLSYKTVVIGSLVLLAIGGAIGKFGTPAKVVTKTVTNTVYKEVESKDTDDQKNTVTTITNTTKPDGTKVETTVIADKDEIKTIDNTQINSTTNIKSSTTTTYSKDNWNVEALMSITKPTLSNFGTVSYGAEIDRRIIGPVSVGAFGFTDQTYGLSLGISF